MLEVVGIEVFRALEERVNKVEADNAFLRSLLTGERWISREQAMKALNCKDSKLRRLTLANAIEHHYEGSKPYYDVFSIRNYLTGQKLDPTEVENRILSANFARL